MKWIKGLSNKNKPRYLTTCSVESTALLIVNPHYGFAPVVTDYSTFAWLCDVFIIDYHKGKGLGKWVLDYSIC